MSSHCFCLSLRHLYPRILAEPSSDTWHASLLHPLDVVPENCCKESQPHHNVATPKISSSPLKSAQSYPHNQWEACKYSKKVQNIPGRLANKSIGLADFQKVANQERIDVVVFFFERAQKKLIFWEGREVVLFGLGECVFRESKYFL